MSTKIGWTDQTWNPITGCTKISPGCKNCYAERMARRLAGRYGYPEAPHHFDVTLRPDRLEQPLRWHKPRKIFVCSMSDLFHEDVPFEFISKVFTTMKACQARGLEYIFLVLTKRPNRMLDYWKWWRSFCISDEVAFKYHDYIWLGVSVENQTAADERIPLLLQIPAVVRFVSMEPMLGPVDVTQYLRYRYIGLHNVSLPDNWPPLDWVIVGAESGPDRRPFDPAWAMDVYEQCQAAGVPFFGKQASGLRPGVSLLLDGWEVKERPIFDRTAILG